ncbi:MAG TPA: hypothetical protein VHY76_11365 [Acetobacteraceae bacterium]|nr:hypothetical protein [Acetobacteraceae bacterium]
MAEIGMPLARALGQHAPAEDIIVEDIIAAICDDLGLRHQSDELLAMLSLAPEVQVPDAAPADAAPDPCPLAPPDAAGGARLLPPFAPHPSGPDPP